MTTAPTAPNPTNTPTATALETHAFHDTHCHLGLMANGPAFARVAHKAGALLFCNSVRPADFAMLTSAYADFPNVIFGAGLHPWYAHEATGADLETLDQAIRANRFVGEIGLDFGTAHAETVDIQTQVFRRICEACHEAGGRVLSIHAVKSAGTALDILEETGAITNCACIFHWFSGTSDELTRARKAGCLFSVGEPMARTKRGRAYIAAIPADQLLLETDAPRENGAAVTFAAHQESLQAACQAIAEAHGNEAVAIVQCNAQAILAGN